jgi:uncharacterized protein with NRDE domain
MKKEIEEIAEEILMSIAREMGDISWDKIKKAKSPIIKQIENHLQQERERIIEKLEIWFKEGTEPIEDVIESLK